MKLQRLNRSIPALSRRCAEVPPQGQDRPDGPGSDVRVVGADASGQESGVEPESPGRQPEFAIQVQRRDGRATFGRHSGNHRRVILPTKMLFPRVVSWVKQNHRLRRLWIDARRPTTFRQVAGRTGERAVFDVVGTTLDGRDDVLQMEAITAGGGAIPARSDVFPPGFYDRCSASTIPSATSPARRS